MSHRLSSHNYQKKVPFNSPGPGLISKEAGWKIKNSEFSCEVRCCFLQKL